MSGPWQPDSEFALRLPRIPRPVPGCMVCAMHVDDHRSARRVGDESAAVDARVLMRRHLERQHS